jgi:uncharacterized membrane protein YuzA (DUF378 family)
LKQQQQQKIKKEEAKLQVNGVLGGSLVAFDSVHSAVHYILKLIGLTGADVQRIVFVLVGGAVVSQFRAYLQAKLVAYRRRKKKKNKTNK